MGLRRFLLILLFTQLFSSFAFAKTLSTTITVYNQGIALVQKTQTIFVKKGVHPVFIKNIPSSIEPSTVFFQDLSHSGKVQILEQRYNDNLISQQELLTRYLGEQIEVEEVNSKTGKIKFQNARLLSISSGVILEINGKVYLTPPGNLIFPVSKQTRFLIKPALSWLIKSSITGEEKIELSYITRGVNWKGNYVAVLSRHHLDIMGWAVVSNQSGAVFHHAALNLVSGVIHLVNPVFSPRMFYGVKGMRTAPMAEAPLQQSHFFEYHLYHLNRRASLFNNQTAQIQFLSAHRVPFQKIYLYKNMNILSSYGENQNHQVGVLLKFYNSKKEKMGVPLPEGKIMMYKKLASMSPNPISIQPSSEKGELLIGESEIGNTPVGEKLEFKIGNAFELSAEEKQLSYQIILPGPNGLYKKKLQIILKNRKKVPVQIRVIQNLPSALSWRITHSSEPYKKISGASFEFLPRVPAHGKYKITYTIRYHS